jgi:hypothetical protein
VIPTTTPCPLNGRADPGYWDGTVVATLPYEGRWTACKWVAHSNDSVTERSLIYSFEIFTGTEVFSGTWIAGNWGSIPTELSLDYACQGNGGVGNPQTEVIIIQPGMTQIQIGAPRCNPQVPYLWGRVTMDQGAGEFWLWPGIIHNLYLPNVSSGCELPWCPPFTDSPQTVHRKLEAR